MQSMFNVRSSRALLPICSRPSPCALRVHRGRQPLPAPPGTLHRAPHRMPSVRLSAVRVGVQPAAELRHLQRHGHVPDVLRALRPVPCTQSAVEPSPARCLCTAIARHLPPPARPAARSARMSSLRLSAVSVGVRPAVELRHVKSQKHALHVLRALRACSALLPISAVEPSPRAACTAVARRLPPAGPQLPSSPRTVCPLLLTLGSARRPSTSRSASTRPASQPWATCSTCASRVPCPGTLTANSWARPRACTPLAPPSPHTRPPLSPGPHLAPRPACPPFDLAGHTLLVRCQQAAHSLRMGGHLGLCLR